MAPFVLIALGVTCLAGVMLYCRQMVFDLPTLVLYLLTWGGVGLIAAGVVAF